MKLITYLKSVNRVTHIHLHVVLRTTFHHPGLWYSHPYKSNIQWRKITFPKKKKITYRLDILFKVVLHSMLNGLNHEDSAIK